MAEFNLGEEVLLKGTITNVDETNYTYTIAVAEGQEVVVSTSTRLEKTYRVDEGQDIEQGSTGETPAMYTYGDVINVDGQNLTITKQAVLKGE